MEIKIKDLNPQLNERQSLLIRNLMKFKVAESKENGWEEYEVEAANMEEAQREVLGQHDIFVEQAN